MDIRMETDMDFMPEPNMESDEFYMTETEMETFIEENPNMIEYADDNVVMLKPSEDFRDLENYDDTVMTESEMLDEEVMMDGPPTMTEIKEEEPEIIEPEMKEEEISNEPEMTEVKEEPKQEEVKETNEATETETDAKPETTTETENTSEKTMATSEERETNNEESTMAENTETETSEAETDTKETVDAKADGDIKGTKIKDRSISIKVKKIIAKLEKTLLDVQDKVKAVQLVTLKGIQAQGVNLSVYNFELKDTIKLNDGNPDFFNQLNIEQQQIYSNVNLNAYSNNDPITIRNTKLKQIDIEKKRLIYEIQKLKKG